MIKNLQDWDGSMTAFQDLTQVLNPSSNKTINSLTLDDAIKEATNAKIGFKMPLAIRLLQLDRHASEARSGGNHLSASNLISAVEASPSSESLEEFSVASLLAVFPQQKAMIEHAQSKHIIHANMHVFMEASCEEQYADFVASFEKLTLLNEILNMERLTNFNLMHRADTLCPEQFQSSRCTIQSNAGTLRRVIRDH